MLGVFSVAVVVEFVVESSVAGVELGFALTGELTSSAQDFPEAGVKVCAAAFIAGVFVVIVVDASSGFVMRSARVPLATAGALLSFGEDIVAMKYQNVPDFQGVR